MKTLEIFDNINNGSTDWLLILLNRSTYVSSLEDIYKNVHWSTIYKSLKLKTIPSSNNSRTDTTQQRKETTTTTCNNVDVSHRYNVEWKKQTHTKSTCVTSFTWSLKNLWISTVIDVKIVVHFGEGQEAEQQYGFCCVGNTRFPDLDVVTQSEITVWKVIELFLIIGTFLQICYTLSLNKRHTWRCSVS